MQIGDHDWLVRLYAFRFLDDLIAEHGDVLPWKPLHDGFEFDGARVTLIGARGIWKPAALDLRADSRSGPIRIDSRSATNSSAPPADRFSPSRFSASR